ncbi:Hypothetical predicted protein [Cloeon dipterum]|nr:Hypothetical predicted protein [Cloeon dipterum]
MSVTLSLFVGSSILATQCGSGWHVACSPIVSAYQAFSREKISGSLGAYIGLNHINVTLTAPPINGSDVNFNERLSWSAPNELQERYRDALYRGLPFPMLTVAEVLQLDQEGFAWGRNYRAAGYYTCAMLWAAFTSWLLMNILLMVVPRYGAYTMVMTGLLVLGADLTYLWLLPEAPLQVRFEVGILKFELGWCFWLNLIAGGVCSAIGLAIACLDLVFPHHFSTILEVDYDTPYDRHVIIEDSRYRGRKKKSGSMSSNKSGSLEEPRSPWSTRILRRLSSKQKLEGIRNGGFEMNAPKSPWNYPHLMRHHEAMPPPQHRGLTRVYPGKLTAADVARQRLEDCRLPAFKRQDSQDSMASSTASSLGLAVLLRSGSYSTRPPPARATSQH